MSIFEGLFESLEEEVARLRDAGLTYLADLPVNIDEPSLKGLVIEVTDRHGEVMTMVPFEALGEVESELPNGLIKRNNGFYTVVVVKSSNPSYKVGGYNLTVSEAELRRGMLVTL